MYGAKDTARFGLELSYDSILRGTNGIVHRRKVRNKFLDITDTPPIDGADIVTTIDVSMQDLAERSLIDELKEINANVGVAIVMDVPTGDIKAIVNMEKCFDGEYREIHNHAVSDLLEPGSVFKPASILVALDDGVVDTTYHVETGRWYMADVRQRNERPQLAKRRIRNADPRTDPVVQFEHRCEPHHRRPLPQQPGEIRKGYLPYRSARRPEDSAGGSNASQNPHAAQKQERTV